MKKKIIAIMLASMLAVSVTACGGSNDNPTADATAQPEEPEAPTDLTGVWQSDSSTGTYMEAIISDNEIEINWIMDDGNTRSIYWIGTYSAPTEAVNEYSWTSERNKDETDMALLASTDDTKDFLYTDGVISYEASMMGTTATVELQKVSNEVPDSENASLNSEDSANGNDADDISSEIQVSPVKTLDGLMCLFITNNSSTTVDELNVQINYKDKNGTTIDMDEDAHDMVLPGYTVVSRMEAPDSYADYEIVTDVELGVNPNYENHSEDVIVNSNQGDQCIIVEITNNADVDIDEVEFIAVLYSGDQIVTVEYPTDVMDIAQGETITEKVDTYDKQYDHFEIYLNQAHTFGF